MSFRGHHLVILQPEGARKINVIVEGASAISFMMSKKRLGLHLMTTTGISDFKMNTDTFFAAFALKAAS